MVQLDTCTGELLLNSALMYFKDVLQDFLKILECPPPTVTVLSLLAGFLHYL